jgi:hypothetical protein
VCLVPCTSLNEGKPFLRFVVTMFTIGLHWALFGARWFQSVTPHPISLRSILILSTYLRLSSSIPSGWFLLYACRFSIRAICPAHHLPWQAHFHPPSRHFIYLEDKIKLANRQQDNKIIETRCNIRDAGGRRQFLANAALLTVSNFTATWSWVRLDTVAQG